MSSAFDFSGREKEFPLTGAIISKTDTKGVITYGNHNFIEMSGYVEEELLGKPHNIIRHPDMPRTIFKLLWSTMTKGEEINAYVVNLSKDGGHYWVYANVTPSYDTNGNIVGYFSVRRKPNRKAIEEVIKPLYKRLIDIEKGDGIEGAIKYLNNILQEKGANYEEFVFSLQA